MLEMGVTCDREKGMVHSPVQLHQVPTGAVRHGKLQPHIHAWCGKQTFPGPARGEAAE